MSGVRISDEQMIEALTTCKDISSASEFLGITRTSIYNRMRKPEFIIKLREERQNKFKIANNKLTDAMNMAINTLISILEDTSINPSTRVKASQTILDICLKSTEQTDILERIIQIEDILQNK